jgi:hypothetical protein
MSPLITPSNIFFTLGIIGVLFTIYNYFRNPQEALERQQALGQSDIDGKAKLLAQQVQWEKEANEKKFIEFGLRLDTAMTLAQNHIHTVDTKVDTLLGTVGKMSNEITRLATIINERIPHKN